MNKYQTMTVKYRFEDLRAALLGGGGGDDDDDDDDDDDADDCLRLPGKADSPHGWDGYDAFMRRIYSSTPQMRCYMMDTLASSLLNENRQVIVFHYNEKGANGKSTKFSLIKQALGDLFVKCSSSLLGSQAGASNPSGPNEELVSTRGKRLVLFSEPSARVKLASSFIKELTGGDEQSTRANYGKKQTFVLNGTVHVLCNKIPETDDMDGGMSRRLRCVPYGSTFVDGAADEANHVFERRDVGLCFASWKFFIMFEMMTAAAARMAARREGRREVVPAPDIVLVATKKLIEREDAIAGFLATKLVRTGVPRDAVTLKDAYDAYCAFCSAKHKPVELSKPLLNKLLLESLGPHSAKHGNCIKWWRGWALARDEDDDVDVSAGVENGLVD